jgi:outer membrane protein OmpA-like peptidoglycan-associated protein
MSDSSLIFSFEATDINMLSRNIEPNSNRRNTLFCRLILFSIIGAYNPVFSQNQNLVPNPSFSTITAPMKSRSQNGEDFTRLVDFWYTAGPHNITPDLITPSFLTDFEQGLLRGNGDSNFAGVVGSGVSTGEYIGVELNDYLRRDKAYSVSFRIAAPLIHAKKIWPGVFQNHFGLLFSHTKIVAAGSNHISGTPQISLYGRQLKARQWTTFKFLLKPESDSLKFLTVGIFQSDKHSENDRWHYYFIDDFDIREALDTAVIEENATSEPNKCPQNRSVFFANGQWNLSQEAVIALDSLVSVWQSCSYKNDIQITGYADHTGRESANLLLSEKRAKQVQLYLSRRGIDTSYFQVIWKGGIIDKNASVFSIGVPENRRVDILFTPADLKVEEANEDEEDFQSVYLFSKELDAMPNGLPKEAGYSFIGHYDPYLARAKDENVYFQADMERISSARPVSAQGYIVSRAKKEKLILLNEAHLHPRHRAFAISLLKKLYDEGFRHLGLEMLLHDGSALNQRGYPTLSDGFFVREPLAGELIRIALETGFRVFGYEPSRSEQELHTADVLKKDSTLSQLSDIELNMLSRDYLQANRIASEMKKYPNEKFIIFAGHGHVGEDTVGRWIPLGLNLKQHFQMDPLSVDQITGDTDIGQSPYSKYAASAALSEPAVLLSNDNQPLVLKKYDFYSDTYRRQFDIQVVHPRSTTTVCRRPEWADLNGGRKMVVVQPPHNLDTPGTTCLVFAFFESESMGEAIPADVTEWKNAMQRPCLMLRKGDYRLFFKFSDGKLATSNAIVK